MADSGMLAHLRDHFHVPPENLATEALAYVLNSSERARKCWQQLLNRIEPELPTLNHYFTQVRNQADGSIPDLVGVAEGGLEEFIGEVKFDAGLTSNQPKTYLKQLLSQDSHGLLLFIVPERRLRMVWNEVRRRSRIHDLELDSDTQIAPGLLSSRCKNVAVAIVTWNELLNTLEGGLHGDADKPALWEVRQLRTMCDEQERHAFLPLEERDVESRIGRRVKELNQLNYEITSDVLRADGTAEALGRVTNTSSWTGRYMMVAGWWCMLQTNFDLWAEERPTPLWFMINDSRIYGYEPLNEALRPLAAEDPSRLIVRHSVYYIPIYPTLRVDRDILRENLVEQVRKIALLMRQEPAPTN